MSRPDWAPAMKVAFALMAVALLIAGCNGPTVEPPTDEAVTPPMDDQGRYVIRATAQTTFSPAKAKVPVGATVVWMNDGGVHNVVADDQSFNSGAATSETGELFVWTFEAAGSFGYFCQPHKSLGMTGTVTVA